MTKITRYHKIKQPHLATAPRHYKVDSIYM